MSARCRLHVLLQDQHLTITQMGTGTPESFAASPQPARQLQPQAEALLTMDSSLNQAPAFQALTTCPTLGFPKAHTQPTVS